MNQKKLYQISEVLALRARLRDIDTTGEAYEGEAQDICAELKLMKTEIEIEGI